MPVVDSIGRLVGRITVDDIIDQVREQSERDYQLASGISADVETTDSIWTQFRARFPWLLIGIADGIANAMILDGDDASWQTVLPGMALFIPLIGGTGGNVGTQSSAIVVQGLANGSLDLRDAGKHILKEFGVALFNATIIAAIVLLYNWIFPTDPNNMQVSKLTSMAVTISLFAVVLFASVFGTLVPIILEKLKIDPAIATGPFVTVTNDIVGMVIYMFISDLLIKSFLGAAI